MDWQPIETAPMDGTRILLRPSFNPNEASSMGYWGKMYGCWYMSDVGHINGLWEPTHWMPLPEPPQCK